MNTVYSNIGILAKKYEQVWWNMPSTLPQMKTFTTEEKNASQKNLNNLIKVFNEQLDTFPKDKSKISAWQDKFNLQVAEYAKSTLGIHNKEYGNLLIEGCTKSAQDFIARVREFDKDISSSDIYQALRNVWIINVIQSIAGKDIACTDSTVGYSLLYPYTDNFLDDCSISKKEKSEMNNRLKERLQGKKFQGTNKHEKKVFSLVSLIESQYKRTEYIKLYDSILSIHKSQCKSLLVQNHESSPYENNILNVSFEKGGSSVAADAYLACGSIDDNFFEFVFAFGLLLQLVDDLQDVKSDTVSHNMTIFSQTIKGHNLDAVTNKLINFVISCIDYSTLKNTPYVDDIKNLITNNLLILITICIYNNKKLYSKEYVKNIEQYFPVSYKYYRNNKNKIKMLKNSLLSIKM